LKEVLTLKADLSKNWPDVMKQDAEKLSNVILFDAVSGKWTRIRSFGIGYGDSPEYEKPDAVLHRRERSFVRQPEGLSRERRGSKLGDMIELLSRAATGTRGMSEPLAPACRLRYGAVHRGI
jgi:hypothetical protein